MSTKRKTLKIIAIVTFSLLLCLAVVGIYLWNMPHIDVQKQEADFTIHASVLVNEYLTDEKAANIKYLGEDGDSKILQVSGNISDISEDMNHQVTILLKSQSDKAGVKCVFMPTTNEHAKALKLGADVQIKGIIRSGAAFDPDLELYENVLLEKCDVISPEITHQSCDAE